MTDIWFPWRHPRARKEHKCDACYRRIDPGEVYVRSAGVYDGWMCDWKMCAHCKAMLSYIDYDSYEGYTAEDFSEFEPSTIPELRMKVHHRMNWRNKAGELFPVPPEARRGLGL